MTAGRKRSPHFQEDMLIDTHAHLDYPDFEADFSEVLARAEAAGVTRIITIGTSLESSRRAVALAQKHPSVYAVIGVHPTSAEEAPDDVITPLRELARHPRVVAIGETGLDYHHLPGAEMRTPFEKTFHESGMGEGRGEVAAAIRDGAYRSAQATIFQQQLDLAAEIGLNVVIHQRDAWKETLDILRDYTGKVRGVFHCFGNSFEQAEEVLGLGHLVSFTGIVTFKNARTVQEVAARVPPDAFMVETDCPYLAPAPFRGKRCEPAHTRVVAETIARLRETGIAEVAEQTTATAEDFFRFG